jgi:CDP-diacylglycerol--glycerol-3-phosphate 3-phosphatidyltransferase
MVAPSHPLLGGVLFSVAAITDLLDGYLARKTGQVTKLGIMLDPIADKLLVISALVIFVDMETIPAWIAIVIIVREFIVTGLRFGALSKNMVIPAEKGGKIKTACQIASIIILFLDRTLISIDLYALGLTLLWIAMVMGIISGVQYFVLFWKNNDG